MKLTRLARRKLLCAISLLWCLLFLERLERSELLTDCGGAFSNQPITALTESRKTRSASFQVLLHSSVTMRR
jgi:hypothetical protein